MSAEQIKLVERDARREPRTSLFVMAALYIGSVSSPVKVRDLSSAGALLEGGGIPLPGTNVRLGRGSLSVMGEVIWRRGERAGVRFESSISVDQWLPGGRAIAPQQRVDEMLQQIKSSESAGSISAGNLAMSQPARVSSVELNRIRIAVESLTDDLASEPDIVKRHMAKLQTLDLVAQVLRKLALER